MDLLQALFSGVSTLLTTGVFVASAILGISPSLSPITIESNTPVPLFLADSADHNVSLSSISTSTESNLLPVPEKTETTVFVVTADNNQNSFYDQRFVGLLSHTRWLLDQRSSGSSLKNNTDFIRLEKQIFSAMDDASEDLSDLSDELTDGANLTETTLVSPIFAGAIASNLALGAYWLSGDGDNEGLAISAGGNVGIGTSTPEHLLTVAGDIFVSGSLYDSTNNAGTNGFVLQSSGVGLQWVSTSSLGIISGGGGGGGLLSTDIDTSSELASILSDETGSGSAVFAVAPTLSGLLTVGGAVNISSVTAGYQIGGSRVLYASSTNSSVVVGLGAGGALLGSGLSNTALGFGALAVATSSDYNTALGDQSLSVTTSGSENTATGYASLLLNRTGGQNTATGYNALYNNTSGAYNTTVGHNALYNNTTGAFNTTLGASAGYDINTAASTGANTMVGYNTGRGIITGINNTILGANVTGLAASLSNNIIIADGAGNRRINVDSNGNVGVGTTTPNARLGIAVAEDTASLALADTTNSDQVNIYTGTTSPEGRVSAPVGSLFLDSQNGLLYQKTGNDNGSAAWGVFTQGTTTHMAQIARATATSMPSGSAPELAMDFDTVTFDQGGLADVLTDRITVKRTGKYIVHAQLYVPLLDDSERAELLIYRNDTDVIAYTRSYSPSANQGVTPSVSNLVELTAGDYITYRFDHTEGAAQNTGTTLGQRPTLTVTEVGRVQNINGGSLFTDTGTNSYLTDEADNILIGTSTNVSNSKFVIRQQNAASSFSIFDGSTEVVTVSDGGNFGLGSTTPSAKLTVVGTATITGLTTLATTSITSLTLAQPLAGTSGGTGLSSIAQNQLLIGGAGNTWAQIATSSLGLSGAFSDSAQLAAILSNETGTGSVAFSSSPTFTGTAVLANVNVTGSLSIGTTSASELFTLDSGISSGGMLITGNTNAHVYNWVHNDNSGSNAFSEFYADNNLDAAMSVGVGSSGSLSGVYNNRAYLWAGTDFSNGLSLIAASTTADIRFFTGGETSANERVRITSSGNVGIGTTTPTGLLSVGGSAANSFLVTNDGHFGFGTVDVEIPTLGTNLQLRDNAIYSGGVSVVGLHIMNNTYYTAAQPKYRTTDEAAEYKIINGAHAFSVTASGTVDSNITWTTPLTINNNGSIDITGTTTITSLTVSGNSSLGTITAGTWNATALTDAYVADAISVIGGNIGSSNASGTLTTTGALTIGDGGDNIVFNSNTWDISGAGVGSGFTGFTTTGLFTAATGTFSGTLGVSGTSTFGALLTVSRTDNNDFNQAGLTFSRSRADAVAPVADFGIGNATILEGFTNNSSVTAGSQHVGWEVNQTNDTTARDSYMAFHTILNNTLAEKMRITSNGNLGIGTTTPGSRLTVSGSSFFGGSMTLNNSLDIVSSSQMSLNGGLLFFDGSAGNDYIWGSGVNTLALATGGFDRVTINGSGYVGIGTTTPGSLLTVGGAINSTDLLGGATTLSTDANGNIIRTPSDARLKTGVANIHDALDTVLALRGVSYEWVDKDRFGDAREVGFLAQEVDVLIPELVRKGGEYWTLNTPNMLAYVVEAIKEMWTKVTTIESDVDTLKQENDTLRARLEALEANQETQNDDEDTIDTGSQNSDDLGGVQNDEEIEEPAVVVEDESQIDNDVISDSSGPEAESGELVDGEEPSVVE